MNRQVSSNLAVVAALTLALPLISEAQCLGPAYSYLIEAEVIDCSSAADAIRDRVEHLDALLRAVDAGVWDPENAASRFLNPQASEPEVQKRLQSGDVVANLSIHRTLQFTESRSREQVGEWHESVDRSPVKYLVTLRGEGCDALRRRPAVTLFAPYECCDNLPGPNCCLLSLPHAVDVPEDLRHHVRSGV